MNRLKYWLYSVVLIGVGLAGLVAVSRWLTQQAIANADRELSAAAAQVEARFQLLGVEAAQLADAVGRDPAVVQALGQENDRDAAAAAQALAQATRAALADPTRALLVATAGRGNRTFRVNGAPVEADARLEGLLSGAAAESTRRQGVVVASDTVYSAAAVGSGRGTSVGVGIPVSAGWLGAIKATSGVDVTVRLDDKPGRTTLAAQDAELVVKSSAGAHPAGAGALPAQATPLGVTLPPPGLLFGAVPAFRVQALPSKALPGLAFVLAAPTRPLLAPFVGYAWLALAVLAILAIAGVVVGSLIVDEHAPVIPKDLLAAADRIGRGDFAARAPMMAGSLGTLAAALNQAAEAAEARLAATAAAAATAVTAVPERDPFEGTGVGERPLHDLVGEKPPDLLGAVPDAGAPSEEKASAPLAASAPPEATPLGDSALEPVEPRAEQGPAPADMAERAAEPVLAANSPLDVESAQLGAGLLDSMPVPPAPEPSTEPAAPLAAAWPPIPEGAFAGPARREPLDPFVPPGAGAAVAADPFGVPEGPAVEDSHTASWAIAGMRDPAPRAAAEPPAAASSVPSADGWAPFGSDETGRDGMMMTSIASALASLDAPPPDTSPEKSPSAEVGPAADASPGAERLSEKSLSLEKSPALDAGLAEPGPTAEASPVAERSAVVQATPSVEPELRLPEPPRAGERLAGAESPDEDHWRSVYDDFLKARERCGESLAGVPFDRFRQKLQKNRDQLVSKYSCKTVKFQVYVKEGKAALKASPVR